LLLTGCLSVWSRQLNAAHELTDGNSKSELEEVFIFP
jgi:hypothetical protein